MAQLAHFRHTKMTPESKAIPLGKGPFIEPGVEDVGEARQCFLRAIEEYAQPLLIALRDRILPDFRDAWAAGRGSYKDSRQLKYEHGHFNWPMELRVKLSQFTQDYHLSKDGKPAGWFRMNFCETLRQWARDPSLAQGEQLSFSGMGYWREEKLSEEDCLIEIPGWTYPQLTYEWNPTKDGETRQQIKQQVLSEVEGLVDARLDEIEQAARRHRLVPTPRKNWEHFKWAVEFQVMEKDMRMFPGCSGPPSTIRDDNRRTRFSAIKSILELIGLTRRQVKTGRPRNRVKRS
jgi:hypothetical protein